MGQQGCRVKKILGHLQGQIDSLSSLTPENYTFFKVNIKLQPAARLLKSSYSDSKKLSCPSLTQSSTQPHHDGFTQPRNNMLLTEALFKHLLHLDRAEVAVPACMLS